MKEKSKALQTKAQRSQHNETCSSTNTKGSSPLTETQKSCIYSNPKQQSKWQQDHLFSSVAQSCPTLCDPMNHSTPCLPVHHQFLEFTQTHVHRVSDVIQPSQTLIAPFSSCPQSLPASESFPMSQLFEWGGQSTGVSALASFLPKKSQGWSPLEWISWISLQSKGLSRAFSIDSSALSFLHSPTLTFIHDHRKNHSLD